MNINRVVLSGNLTKDPELRTTTGGTTICSLRIASNARRKNGSSGEWEDKPNYFDVTIFGGNGENAARYLSKGRMVFIDGRLDWREWETDSGGKRQAVQIIADNIQFVGDGKGGGPNNGNGGGADIPIDTSDFTAAAANPADDEIPF